MVSTSECRWPYLEAGGGYMDDRVDTVTTKVAAISSELVDGRATRLDGSVLASQAMDAIASALTPEYGKEKATAIGLHMADWNSNAAFVVALHLFLERFTPDEVKAGRGPVLGACAQPHSGSLPADGAVCLGELPVGGLTIAPESRGYVAELPSPLCLPLAA
jgi:hypothetical protein